MSEIIRKDINDEWAHPGIVKERSEQPIEEWIQKLTCPIIRVNTVNDIEINVKKIVKQYRNIMNWKRK